MFKIIIKNFYRILKDHRFYLFIIIFYELIYFLKGYKGFTFNFSTNSEMSDNIPCPFYFLKKIKKNLQKEKFKKFLDLGCGSGRVIDFFNKNFNENKSFLGIEYFDIQYEICKKNFINQDNIKIIKSNFNNSSIFKNDFDCCFLNAPFKKNEDFLDFMSLMQSYCLNKRVLFITVNIDKNIVEKINNIEFIENFFIGNNKGFSIFYLNAN